MSLQQVCFSHIICMQSVKPVGTIHNGAASTVFPVLLIMCTIQTGITCKIQHVFGGHGVLLGVQVALTVLCWLAGITCKYTAKLIQSKL